MGDDIGTDLSRTISFTRKYNLGDFQNVDFGDMIINIPAKHVLNQPLIEKLFIMEMLTVELAFRRYAEIRKKYLNKNLAEALTELELDRNTVFNEIKELLNKENTDEN